MKKSLSLILALVMCLSLCACSGGEQNNETQGNTEINNTSSTTIENNAGDTSDTSDTDNSQVEAPNHPLVQDICGEWKAGDGPDKAPFQSLVIKEDGSCIVDGTSATWNIEGSYTDDTHLSIRILVDGKVLCGMVYNSEGGYTGLTKPLDENFDNSPMSFAQCEIVKN